MTPRPFLPSLLILILLAGCAPAPKAIAAPTFTPQRFAYAPLDKPGGESFSATPTQTRTEIPRATPSPLPTASPTQTPPAQPTIPFDPPALPPAVEISARANYILYALMDFPARALSVSETIRYANQTGVSLADVVLSIQPNRWAGVFTLSGLTQDGAALTDFTLDGQRLTLALPQPLLPGAATTFKIDFTLALPQKGDGLFGYDFNQINLVDWYPFIVPYQNGWALHDPMPFGEHLVYDAADIELNIQTGADVILAAGAPAEPNGEWTRYRIYGARGLSLSASDEFLAKESAVGQTVIRAYYFSGYEAAAESILYSAQQAVALFEAKFAPYPYETLSITQADIHDGQEYDGLVFVSSKFYGQYGGGAKNNLTAIGAHEIAHQWWFGLVGSDQALNPWLDEALAMYSEKMFFEYNYPKYEDWWWQFRVDYFGGSGYVDSSIYDHSSFRSYTNAVYLNGAHFMEDLRVVMGEDDFIAFLRDYAEQRSRGLADPQDFFTLAREHTSEDLSHLIAKYFAESY